MAANTQIIKHGWVWSFFILLFFFNTIAVLPEGLTLVLLFTPVWVYFLYRQDKLKAAVVLALPLLVYALIHLYNGVNINYFVISLTIIVALIFFIVFLYFLINNTPMNLDLIFKDIAIFNFFLAVGSLVFLFIPQLKGIVWYMVPISENIKPIPRLKLFTSEASHYSFLFAPIAIYFYSRAIFFKTSKPLLTIAIITFPLIISFSLGVLFDIFITGLLIFCLNTRKIFYSKQRFLRLLGLVALSVIVLIIVYYIFPNNPFFQRIHNIFYADDTSARGRTYESFILADKIAAQKSLWWGIGPGQLKLLGRNIVIQYYYYSTIPGTIRIPNACAETIAYFGYIGFALRMFIEIWLFFKTKVYRHPYRFWLFLFVFIYQFTGSYITNTAEYFIWILAFSNIFPEYNALKRFSIKNNP